MSDIVPKLRWSVKEKMRRQFRKCRIALVRTRYLIIFNLLNGRSARETAEVQEVHVTTVYRVAKRFREQGEWTLWDGREDNGPNKLTEYFLDTLYQVVRTKPST